MGFYLKHLRLRAETTAGVYGTDIPFVKGLNLLWADNSMGKSTCAQSIIYALGLERMLSPSLDVPLPPVMLSKLERPDGTEIDVVRSYIILEVENERGEVISVLRHAKDDNENRMISVFKDHSYSSSDTHPNPIDYFVHDAGAAVRELGFHKMLADFLGWKLPSVTRFNGAECPLYLECIFPLLIVEQKHGWSGIQGNLPTFIGVREMSKRSIEFLLQLDSYHVAQRRQELKQSEAFTQERWTEHVKFLSQRTKEGAGRVNGLPRGLTDDWAEESNPILELFWEDAWISLTDAIQKLENVLEANAETPVPNTGEVNEEASAKLSQLREKLAEYDYTYNQWNNALLTERVQLEAIDQRLKDLEQDLQKHKDVKKLQSWGSSMSIESASDKCPTCHQHIADSLLITSTPTMSIEDNIAFLTAQLDTFRKMRLNISNSIRIQEAKVASILGKTKEIRLSIRAIKETLVTPASIPSVSDIRERLIKEDKLREFENLKEFFEKWITQARALFADWARIQKDKEALPADPLTQSDKNKLTKLQTHFLRLVREYGLTSVKPETLSISPETYRPMREGFNLGFDLSASDGIRVIWSYLFGLLETAREVQTNHPGFLIFDEPKQQSANQMSFASLLREATEAKKFNQQVFFASSEPLADLKNALIGYDFKLVEISGKVLKPIL